MVQDCVCTHCERNEGNYFLNQRKAAINKGLDDPPFSQKIIRVYAFLRSQGQTATTKKLWSAFICWWRESLMSKYLTPAAGHVVRRKHGMAVPFSFFPVQDHFIEVHYVWTMFSPGLGKEKGNSVAALDPRVVAPLIMLRRLAGSATTSSLSLTLFNLFS
jgi:hypothetical protein